MYHCENDVTSSFFIISRFVTDDNIDKSSENNFIKLLGENQDRFITKTISTIIAGTAELITFSLFTAEKNVIADKSKHMDSHK